MQRKNKYQKECIHIANDGITFSTQNPTQFFFIHISGNIAFVISNYLSFTLGVILKYFVNWNKGIIIGFDTKDFVLHFLNSSYLSFEGEKLLS